MANVSPALIGSRLARARNSLGLSQEQVAVVLDVERALVSSWESGQTPIDSVNLSRLAALYGHSVRDFLAPPGAELPEVNFGPRIRESSRDDRFTIGWAKRVVANLADLREVYAGDDDWI